MPHTKLIYHIVFGTKYRRKVLTKDKRTDLFKFIWGILEKKKCHLYRMNGVEDYIHILTSMRTTMDVANLVKDIKVASHLWIEENEIFPEFIEWQVGYGAFTVSAYEKDGLIEYIKNQEAHHKIETFEDEYRRLLKEHDIDFDEKYLFDE
jgi:REP element-mobilizing transposase RayT|tara:strand:- start:110 stop:559 length:450 start_codon:yes stop_codon:yes gene_type:complete